MEIFLPLFSPCHPRHPRDERWLEPLAARAATEALRSHWSHHHALCLLAAAAPTDACTRTACVRFISTAAALRCSLCGFPWSRSTQVNERCASERANEQTNEHMGERPTPVHQGTEGYHHTTTACSLINPWLHCEDVGPYAIQIHQLPRHKAPL